MRVDMEKSKKDKIEFAKVMYGLAGNFGGQISKDDLSLRFEVLKEYSLDEIKQAGIWLLKNREQTFPAVPTTREIIIAVEKIDNPQAAISIEARSEIQLQCVLNKLRTEGSNSDVDFNDPVTQELMTRRWPYNQWARTVLEDEIKWFCKEFKELYKVYDKNKVVELGLLEAPGEKTHQIPAGNLKKLISRQ